MTDAPAPAKSLGLLILPVVLWSGVGRALMCVRLVLKENKSLEKGKYYREPFVFRLFFILRESERAVSCQHQHLYFAFRPRSELSTNSSTRIDFKGAPLLPSPWVTPRWRTRRAWFRWTPVFRKCRPLPSLGRSSSRMSFGPLRRRVGSAILGNCGQHGHRPPAEPKRGDYRFWRSHRCQDRLRRELRLPQAHQASQAADQGPFVR